MNGETGSESLIFRSVSVESAITKYHACLINNISRGRKPSTNVAYLPNQFYRENISVTTKVAQVKRAK